MKNLITIITIFYSLTLKASYILPEDYKETNKFIKISLERIDNKDFYLFFECDGEINTTSCTQIFYQGGYSKKEIQAIRKQQRNIGFGILAAEIAVGGFIWKKLLKFTLGKAARMTAARTGWSEGVANGTVALALTSPITLATSYFVVSGLEDLLNIVDSGERFDRSELMQLNNEQQEAILNTSYSFEELYEVLDQLLNN